MLVERHPPTTVQLTPPIISKATIAETIVCTRPMREGKFNISLTHAGGKTIVNCYGHGGSGWATLFGSIMQAISLFEAENPGKSVPIRVIGSGCMGLTSAIELSRLGYHVKGIFTKERYNIASWSAGGYLAIVSVKTDPDEQANLDKIGIDSFQVYHEIEHGEHPYISSDAVGYMPVYGSKDTESGLENLERLGIIPPREYVTIDFGNGVVHHGFVKYMTYFLNTPIIMQQLAAEVDRIAIPIEQREVRCFGDIEEEVIFNCSGLGGIHLNDDRLMIPVRGHLVALNSGAGQEHMNYMIYSKVEQEGRDEYVYLFPKSFYVPHNSSQRTSPSCGILGGTFIPTADSLSVEEQQAIDAKEFERMLERSSFFFSGHPYK